MRCRKCDVPFTLTPPAPAPAWADPRAVMAGSAWKFSVGVVPDGNTHQIAPADPRRVAIGFITDRNFSANYSVRPEGVPDWAGWYLQTPASPIWFTLFEHGPLVTAAWVAGPLQAGQVGVYEVYRLF